MEIRFSSSGSLTHGALVRQGDKHNRNGGGGRLIVCAAVFRRWWLVGRPVAALERTYMAEGRLGRCHDREKKMGWCR
jgi:hypothetical protein